MRNTSISYVKTRLVKDIVTNSKAKERSRYQLTDDKDIVDDKTIVFESFGGKNYSDSPKYIYEYMQQHYPQLNYIWVCARPEQTVIPGNAIKVQKVLGRIIKHMLKQNIGFLMLVYHCT